jgi:hypothetical protein
MPRQHAQTDLNHRDVACCNPASSTVVSGQEQQQQTEAVAMFRRTRRSNRAERCSRALKPRAPFASFQCARVMSFKQKMPANRMKEYIW